MRQHIVLQRAEGGGKALFGGFAQAVEPRFVERHLDGDEHFLFAVGLQQVGERRGPARALQGGLVGKGREVNQRHIVVAQDFFGGLHAVLFAGDVDVHQQQIRLGFADQLAGLLAGRRPGRRLRSFHAPRIFCRMKAELGSSSTIKIRADAAELRTAPEGEAVKGGVMLMSARRPTSSVKNRNQMARSRKTMYFSLWRRMQAKPIGLTP